MIVCAQLWTELLLRPVRTLLAGCSLSWTRTVTCIWIKLSCLPLIWTSMKCAYGPSSTPVTPTVMAKSPQPSGASAFGEKVSLYYLYTIKPGLFIIILWNILYTTKYSVHYHWNIWDLQYVFIFWKKPWYQSSLLTSSWLACLLLSYWLFISTYLHKAHILRILHP